MTCHTVDLCLWERTLFPMVSSSFRQPGTSARYNYYTLVPSTNSTKQKQHSAFATARSYFLSWLYWVTHCHPKDPATIPRYNTLNIYVYLDHENFLAAYISFASTQIESKRIINTCSKHPTCPSHPQSEHPSTPLYHTNQATWTTCGLPATYIAYIERRTSFNRYPNSKNLTA